jgi:hypothetical protein
MRSYKSKKDRKCIGQKKRDKRTNNDLQSIIQKTKDQAKRTPPQKMEMYSDAPEGLTVLVC